jgi:hypothetical protein
MKIFIPAALLAVSAITLLPNHKKATVKTLGPQDYVINASINNLKPGATIPKDFLGYSYEVTSLTDTVYFRNNHYILKNLLTNLGTGVIRINGYYTTFIPWANHKRYAAMNKPNHTYLTDSITTSDLDTLFSFARATKWKVMLGINSLKSNPRATFSEVSYAWSKGKDVLYSFEMGNEPEGAFKSKFSDYSSAVNPHYSMIKSNSSNIPLCGPASLYPNLFLKDFLRSSSNEVKFVTVHEYPVGEEKVPNSVYQLLANKCAIKADQFSNLVDSLSKTRNLRYRISECNNYADEGANVADRFASALWGLDYMFTVASNNCLGVNFHGGSRGFTPIFVKKGEVTAPRPLYYAMLFFHLASQGRLLPVNLNKNNPDVKAYAVSGNSKVYVTLINKNINNDAKITLSLGQKLGKASLIRLLGPNVFSKDSVTLGGASIAKNGKWKAKPATAMASQGGTFTVTVPKGSAALVTLSN